MKSPITKKELNQFFDRLKPEAIEIYKKILSSGMIDPNEHPKGSYVLAKYAIILLGEKYWMLSPILQKELNNLRKGV